MTDRDSVGGAANNRVRITKILTRGPIIQMVHIRPKKAQKAALKRVNLAIKIKTVLTI